MNTKMLGLLAVGLLAGPIAAQADVIYSWEIDKAANFSSATFAANETFRVNYTITLTPTITGTGGDTYGECVSFLDSWAGSGSVCNDGSVVSYSVLFGLAGSGADVIGNIGENEWINTVAFQTRDEIPPGDFVQAGQDSWTFRYTITAAPVPEPGTLALLGLGLAGLGLSRRRKAN